MLSVKHNHSLTMICSPITMLTLGLFIGLLILQYFTYIPPTFLIIIATVLSPLFFYFGRFIALGISLAIISMGLNITPPYNQDFSSCKFIGTITKTTPYRGFINIKTETIFCDKSKLRKQTIQYWDAKQQFQHSLGKTFNFQAQLSPTHSRLNKHEFNYEKFLFSQGILLQAKHLTTISKLAQTSPILRIKSQLQQQIKDNLSKANVAIITALVTGDRRLLTNDEKVIMQQTGTSHLLAISGLHLALIGAWAWLFFQIIWALAPRLHQLLTPIQAGAIFAFTVITVYALLTGFQVPVKRAWIMLTILLISWLRLHALNYNSLFLAAIAVLIIEPLAVQNVGFYFSFIASHIVISISRLNCSSLAKILMIQGLINLTLLPITWYYFGHIPFVSLISNLVVIPWLSLWVLPFAIVANLIESISPYLAQPLWAITEFSSTAMWSSLQFFQKLNLTLNPSFQPALITTVICVCTILVAFQQKKPLLLLITAILFIPNFSAIRPALLVADSKQTSVLIHNQSQAFIINPGWRYQQRNDAKKWLNYLRKNNLTLAAIILNSDKITKNSASKSLIEKYPHAKIILLERFDFPYPTRYCQAIAINNLTLHTKITGEKKRNCQATLYWFGQPFELFQHGENAILEKSQLRWQGIHYNANKLGMISLNRNKQAVKLSYLRDTTTLWQIAIQKHTDSNRLL